jgi:glutaredoxin-related protein
MTPYNESRSQVKYSIETCKKATISAIDKLDGLSIDEVDNVTNTIYVKGKMTLFSWGEIIEVNLTTLPSGLTEIIVKSNPKVGGSANAPGFFGDMGKSQRNVINIMTAISNELKQYSEINPIPQRNLTSNDAEEDIFDKLKKLGELRSKQVITIEEFDFLKKDLLSKMADPV